MVVKLELPDEMVDIIGKALSEIPYKFAAPVIAELQKQINGQRKGVPNVEELKKEVSGE